MTNTCIYCKKVFKHLGCHYTTPPKYCIAIRESFRCKNGCKNIISDEPLESHITHCDSYLVFQARSNFNRLLELEKISFQKDLEREKWTFDDNIRRLTRELDLLKQENAKLIETHAKEYTSLTILYNKLDVNYNKLALTCANKTTTINHHNTQNNQHNSVNQYLLNTPPLDLTNPSKLQLIMEEFYTEAYFLQGSKGLASFLVEYYLTDTGKAKYLTSDASRFNFKFNSEGTITNDKEARMLITFVVPIVCEIIRRKFRQNIDYYVNDYELEKLRHADDCYREICSLANNNTEFCKRLVSMTKRDNWLQVEAITH